MSHTVETAISKVYADRILVRGYNIVDLAAACSYGEVLYLLLRGELPTRNEGALIEAMLVVMVEHSINAPSTHTARMVANCGSPVQSAVAAGISAIGDYHGGAGEECARMLQEEVARAGTDFDPADSAHRVVRDARAAGIRLPGFGHRVHDPDPRAIFLLARARDLGIAAKHTALAESIVAELLAQTGKSLPLNVDGALAALISDMVLDYRMGKGFFIVARTAGLLAHVQEEMREGKPFKFAAKVPATYVGPDERPLPPVA
jgi:citrate synthase